MQRCGIGGEGETGAFKCLTPSTLSPAPDAGPFFESRAAHHRAALSPATPPSVSHRKQGPSSGFLRYLGCRSQQEKPRPWLGVRGEAEISGYNTFAEEASAPKQFGARRLVPLPDKESPAEAGQGLSWKENQDEETGTDTQIAAVLRLGSQGSAPRTRPVAPVAGSRPRRAWDG